MFLFFNFRFYQMPEDMIVVLDVKVFLVIKLLWICKDARLPIKLLITKKSIQNGAKNFKNTRLLSKLGKKTRVNAEDLRHQHPTNMKIQCIIPIHSFKKNPFAIFFLSKSKEYSFSSVIASMYYMFRYSSCKCIKYYCYFFSTIRGFSKLYYLCSF